MLMKFSLFSVDVDDVKLYNYVRILREEKYVNTNELYSILIKEWINSP
jgi:hypothetical protein